MLTFQQVDFHRINLLNKITIKMTDLFFTLNFGSLSI